MIFGHHQLPDVTHLTARLFIQATRLAPQTPGKVISCLPLTAGGPDVADVAVTLAEAVQRVIALTTGTDETAEGVALVLAGVATVLVNLGDGDLDGGVVVGLDDAVGGAALAGDVAVRKEVKRLVVCVLQCSMLLVHNSLLVLLVSGSRGKTLRKRTILQHSHDEG